jgi:hypothetical protein
VAVSSSSQPGSLTHKGKQPSVANFFLDIMFLILFSHHVYETPICVSCTTILLFMLSMVLKKLRESGASGSRL